MAMIPLSQAHLTLLDTCDRKYRYVFFDALSAPTTYDQQLKTQWGSQFHLLMQQRALDLPVEALTDADREMAASMDALATAAPDVFEHLPETYLPGNQLSQEAAESFSAESFSQSEHRRTLAFDSYLLTVVYDLLVCTPERGEIFDWKTHQRPPKKEWLQNDWQTRLYLYVLCETTDLKPEQISMTYWFVRLGDSPEERLRQRDLSEKEGDARLQKKPSSHRFSYSAAQHRRTAADVRSLTSRLTRMVEQGEFPKVPLGSKLCEDCAFNLRCDRPSGATPLFDAARMLREASQIALESVEELPL